MFTESLSLNSWRFIKRKLFLSSSLIYNPVQLILFHAGPRKRCSMCSTPLTLSVLRSNKRSKMYRRVELKMYHPSIHFLKTKNTQDERRPVKPNNSYSKLCILEIRWNLIFSLLGMYNIIFVINPSC